MKKTTILVLELVVCLAAIAHAASFYRPQSWRVKKHMSDNTADDVGLITSKRLPDIEVKQVVHPGPELDEDVAIPPKRKQVGLQRTANVPLKITFVRSSSVLD